MSIDLALYEYIEKFHQDKDPMHDVSHIRRLRFSAKHYANLVGIPAENVSYALYFHGLNEEQKDQLAIFMQSYGFEESASNYFIYLESFTSKNVHPVSDEEKLIHDTHLLEGGPHFPLIKSLITGTHRDQSLEFTINLYEYRIMKGAKCYFPETKAILEEQQKLAKETIASLRENLPNELSFPH